MVEGYRLLEAQDFDVWLRLASTGQTLYRTGFPVSCYRVHQGQASKSRGFMLSTSKSPPIEAEKSNLARKLTSSVKGWPESKESLVDQIKRHSLLARIEINGPSSWLKPKGLRQEE